MKKVFKVSTNSDKTEGRGGYSTVGVFTSRVDADLVASDTKYCDFYGKPDGHVEEIEIFETLGEFREAHFKKDTEWKEYQRLRAKFG